MQANELRVGNWVQVKHTGHYVQIGHRDIGYIIEGSDNYSPIPLTPEILEQCGFEVTAGGKTSNYRYYASFGFVDVKFCEEGITTYLCFGGVKTAIHDSITSLHQLQNIYFSLTNTELQWKRKQ